MRKVSILLIIEFTVFVLFLNSGHVFGQEKVLVLKNRVTGKEIEFHEGDKLKVFCIDSTVYRGHLQLADTTKQLTKNEIEINHIILNINNITNIRPISVDRNKEGTRIIGFGTLCIIAGIYFINKGEADEASSLTSTETEGFFVGLIGLTAIIVGIPITIAGIITIVGGKEYNSKQWIYSILPVSE